MHCTMIRSCLFLSLCLVSSASAESWWQFRGPQGRGISSDARVPTTWRDDHNLAWTCPLPGPGSSSPIVVNDRVFVTCYSGYGVDDDSGGDTADLTRHVVCVDRNTGTLLWSKAIPAAQPEDPYSGYLQEHGYASNTPVSDGENVYVFFSKSGVFCFSLNGEQRWHVLVGNESSNREWGSGASPIIHGDTLIVNAADECRAVVALDKRTGKERWKAEADLLELTYGTPGIVKLSNRTEIVLAVPSEVWGLDAETGKLKWFAETRLTGNISPSPVVDGEMVYAFGGYRSAGSHAIRAGGQGDVTGSRMAWSSRNSSYVASPLLYLNHLYWIDDRGQAWCVSATDGELVYRERVKGLQASNRPVYASPILVGQRIYVVTRRDGTLVLPAKPEFRILEQNRIMADGSDFNATPAVSDGALFLRSNRFLYCIKDEG